MTLETATASAVLLAYELFWRLALSALVFGASVATAHAFAKALEWIARRTR